MPAIHQLVAGFSRGDAISNEAVVLRNIFQGWGYDSDIFSESRRILPELRKTARDVATCAERLRPDDIAFLHLSIGSPVNDAFAELNCRKVILYHNITPPHYLELINRQMASQLQKGRRQLDALAGCAEVNLADSAYNARELEAAGYRDVEVLPLVLDLDKVTGKADRRIAKQLDDGNTHILFVGRCVPNKCLQDALRVFAIYHKKINPRSRFIHVGSFAGTERYYYLLLTLAREIGNNCVQFARSVPQAELNACYRGSDVFLSMSEHEGFCIPLIESMACDLPVVAHAAAAVPETMDGAGILCHGKPFEAIAEMLGELTSNTDLRNAVIAGQRERIARYRARNLEQELKNHLGPLLASPGPGYARTMQGRNFGESV